ncbi:MAG: hypothetical protein NT166_01795 [Candidatus Aminicenantes bacterium]|nr:hypothetical protein [Candidatus Aminicenantes bacterium]
MNTAQLKDRVVDKIYGINDEDYLNAITKILDTSYPARQIYHLNGKQKLRIELGRRQISEGDHISNEELEKEEDKWLNE